MPGADERRRVTVLFADLAGSTDLATRHDAEALRALLSAFLVEMRLLVAPMRMLVAVVVLCLAFSGWVGVRPR